MNIKRILILAPHTDDAELGCGGTMSRFLEDGAELHVAVFSTAEESLPPGSPPNLLRDEFYDAMSHLSIPKENLIVMEYPVRRLSYHRQEVLESLVRLGRTVAPDMVFLPSGSDLHQDHQVVHAEGLRAFKHLNIWGYELPWNHVSFATQGFVRLESRHMDDKWTALQSYRSQLKLERPYFTKDFIFGLARVRGTQIRSEFAEAFEVIRARI